MRIFFACIAAAGAAAFPTILFGPWAIIVLPVAFLIAAAHAFLIGLPAYLVLRERRPVDWPEALYAGFLIGALPLTVWQLFINAMSGEFAFSIPAFVIFGVLGMIGGLVFRAVVGRPEAPEREHETAAIFE